MAGTRERTGRRQGGQKRVPTKGARPRQGPADTGPGRSGSGRDAKGGGNDAGKSGGKHGARGGSKRSRGPGADVAGSRRSAAVGGSRRKDGGQRQGRASSEVGGAVLRKAFPNLRRKGGGGFGVLVGVVEGYGSAWDAAEILDDRTVGGRSKSSTGGQSKPKRWGNGKAQRARLADIMAAVGSGHRMQILVKLLEGPATYRSLQKTTGLKSGPLYHHIAQLRLAGLVGPKRRDLYELTRGGRNLVLVVLTLPKLIQDRRPRPVPDGRAGV